MRANAFPSGGIRYGLAIFKGYNLGLSGQSNEEWHLEDADWSR